MFDRFNAWATALLAGSKDESGQTFVEYALILAVVVVAVLLAVVGRPWHRDPGCDHAGQQRHHRRVDRQLPEPPPTAEAPADLSHTRFT